MITLRKLNCGFAAGAVGALVLLALLCILGFAALPVPPITLELVYRDITWGGIWGLPLALPWLLHKWWLRGAILGAAAFTVLILVFIPNGLQLPALALGIALFVNVVWGLSAAYWYKATA
jgi:hypothetical protein